MKDLGDQSDPSPTNADPLDATDRAMWVTVLYKELRALAQSELSHERREHTLSATALVNEVYLKFSASARVGSSDTSGDSNLNRPVDRATFFGAAAQAMRRILLDHARRKNRQKRGGGKAALGSDVFDTVADPLGSPAIDPVELDDALTRLAVQHADAARVVELRFFAGLPEKTIAEVIGVNERTVRRHWTFAKAWLARDMHPDGGHPPSPARDPS